MGIGVLASDCITKDTPPPFKLPYTTFGYTPQVARVGYSGGATPQGINQAHGGYPDWCMIGENSSRSPKGYLARVAGVGHSRPVIMGLTNQRDRAVFPRSVGRCPPSRPGRFPPSPRTVQCLRRRE